MKQTIAVIGLGLIGGSLAAALRRAGARVVGFDVSAQHRDIARERELVDDVADHLGNALEGADAVILATPLGATLDLLPSVAAGTRDDTLILDTASVKSPVVEAMERIAHPERAIGGHPLAGSERSGPRFADAELFTVRLFFLTPSPRTEEGSLDRAMELVRALKSLPIVIAAAGHDERMARISHLPQLVSTTLALGLGFDDRPIAGPGLKDMTRLARSDVGMWEEIVAANRHNIGVELRALIGRLDEMASAVERDDRDAIGRLLRAGRDSAGALA